jgi:hypothetical protein
MPDYNTYQQRLKPRTWKEMERWERKEWHRENDLRKSRGLPLLKKP